jgi:hypothetical protein
MLDATTTDSLNGNDLAAGGSSTVALPNGRTGRRIANNAIGLWRNGGDGLMLTGGRPWTVCGFYRPLDVFDSDVFFRIGGSSDPATLGPRLSLVSRVLTLSYRDDTWTARTISAGGVLTNNTFMFVAAGFDGSNIWVKYTTDGTTWTSGSLAISGSQPELYDNQPCILGSSTTSSLGANVDLAQWVVSRDVLDEDALEWLANGMAGRDESELVAYFGSYPEMDALDYRVHDASLVTSSDTATGCYFLRPYPLHEYDPSLAASLGRYVWFSSSDHDVLPEAGSGIVMGFSEDPAIAPTSWSLIWRSPTNGVTGYNQSETPWLVYNPDDATRPFYLYLHETSPSIGGYSNPQETRLISSGNLASWTNEGIVIPVNTGGRVYNHKGYAHVFRRGTGDWDAWHLVIDGSSAHFGRSSSTDGKAWTAVLWNTNFYVPQPVQQWAIPGKRIGLECNEFELEGVAHRLCKMDNHTGSTKAVNDRYLIVVPTSDGTPSGHPKLLATRTGTYPNDDYLQSVASLEEDGVLHVFEKFHYQSPDFVQYGTLVCDTSTANTARPVGFRKTDLGGGQVKLDWYDALPHQDYRVYRDIGVGYVLLANVTGLTYTDTPVVGASYVVRSVYSGSESTDSAVLTFP